MRISIFVVAKLFVAARRARVRHSMQRTKPYLLHRRKKQLVNCLNLDTHTGGFAVTGSTRLLVQYFSAGMLPMHSVPADYQAGSSKVFATKPGAKTGPPPTFLRVCSDPTFVRFHAKGRLTSVFVVAKLVIAASRARKRVLLRRLFTTKRARLHH